MKGFVPVNSHQATQEGGLEEASTHKPEPMLLRWKATLVLQHNDWGLCQE